MEEQPSPYKIPTWSLMDRHTEVTNCTLGNMIEPCVETKEQWDTTLLSIINKIRLLARIFLILKLFKRSCHNSWKVWSLDFLLEIFKTYVNYYLDVLVECFRAKSNNNFDARTRKNIATLRSFHLVSTEKITLILILSIGGVHSKVSWSFKLLERICKAQDQDAKVIEDKPHEELFMASCFAMNNSTKSFS